MVDFDTLGEELDDVSSSNGGSSSNDTVNYYGTPILDPRPQIILDAEAILNVGFTGDVTDEQNLRGAANWQDEGAIVVTLLNPEVTSGDLWKATGRDDDQSAKYKLVSLDADDVEENLAKDDDGEVFTKGLQVGSGTFDGEEVPEVIESAGMTLDDETLEATPVEEDDVVVRMFVDGGVGQRIGQVLDRLGGQSAYYVDPEDAEDYGSDTGGLVEYPPNYGTDEYSPREGDNYPRIARTPDLRASLEDQPTRFIFTFGDTSGGFAQHNAHVVTIDEVGSDVDMETVSDRAMVPLDEETMDEAPENNAYVFWTDIADVVSSDESVEDATPDGDFSAAPSDDEDLAYEDLTASQEAFVEHLASEHEGAPFTTDDFDDWDDTVAQAVEEDGMDEVNADALGEILDDLVAASA